MNTDRLKHVVTLWRQPRYSLWLDLAVELEGSSQPLPVRPPDISPQGMFLNTAQSFPLGTVLKISFRLPGANFRVQARGEVRYCLEGVGVGVEFIDISAQAKAAIVSALERAQ
jgi:hypothetical protein